MAKVYDALKQVEAERSRQLRAVPQRTPAAARVETNFWRRWSERLAGGVDGTEKPVAPDHAMRERIDTILGRLDAFESLASRRIPEIERNLLQLLESRIDAVEREVGSSVSTLGHQMRQDVAVLNRRLSALLVAVAVLLVALLVRT